MQKDVTIILPLKDRSVYTNRWMQNNLFDCFDYIICDGSRGNENQSIVNEWLKKKENITYVRSNFDATHRDYVKKMLAAVELVKTKHVMLADNDDFISKDNIVTGSFNLQSNSQLRALNGKMGYLWERGEKFCYLGSMPEGKNFNEQDAILRLNNFASTVRFHIWYALHDTQSLLSFWQIAVKSDVTNLYLLEDLMILNTLCSGQIETVREVSYLRVQNPVTSPSKLNSSLEIFENERYDFLLNESYLLQVTRFFTELDNRYEIKRDFLLKIYRKYLLLNYLPSLKKSIIYAASLRLAGLRNALQKMAFLEKDIKKIVGRC